MYYDDTGTQVGWGYQSPPDSNEIRYFKLSLLHGDDWPSGAQNWPVLKDSVDRRIKLNKTITTVYTDFIRAIWNIAGLRSRRTSHRGPPDPPWCGSS